MAYAIVCLAQTNATLVGLGVGMAAAAGLAARHLLGSWRTGNGREGEN